MPRRTVGLRIRPLALLLVAVGLLGLVAGPAAGDPGASKIKVTVAAETWGQLVYVDSKGQPAGPIVDFVRRMNVVQDRFDFAFIVLPRLRLNQYFIEKKADVYPLRTTLWTEPQLNLLPTRTILTSGDVYVARAANAYGGNRICEGLSQRRLVGVRGYHYRIFNNNPDEAYIKKNFHADLLNSNEAVIAFVLAGHGDVGIVPELIVAQYLKDPTMHKQLLVCNQFDSRVEFSNLVRKDGPISVDEMNAIVGELIESGDVARLEREFKVH